MRRLLPWLGPRGSVSGPRGRTGTRYQVRVPGIGCRLSGTGTWYPAPEPVRRRGLNTEHRRPSPATGKRAHGFASCILHLAYPVCGFFEDKRLVPGSGSRVPGTWHPVPGTGAGPTPRTEHRAPKTEPSYRKTRTPGIASCILRTPCAGFLKTSAWYRVPGPGYLAPGTRDRINAEGRTPSTEDRAQLPENAHTGLYPASCILHPVSCIYIPRGGPWRNYEPLR
jgi:hypothetical protein